jgi:hypothetical protein
MAARLSELAVTRVRSAVEEVVAPWTTQVRYRDKAEEHCWNQSKRDRYLKYSFNDRTTKRRQA